MTIGDDELELLAVDCERLAGTLRFLFGLTDPTAVRLMAKAERLRKMKRGY